MKTDTPCSAPLAQDETNPASPRLGQLLRVQASLDLGVCLRVKLGTEEVLIPLDPRRQEELTEVLASARAADNALIGMLSSHSLH